MFRRSSLLALAAAAALSFCGVAKAGSVSITVTPSLAPNAYGSPSFDGYQSNAISALKTGASSYGDPTQPTYYQAITGPLNVADNIVTNFPSWRGSADVGGAYANEYGNRVTFGFHAVAEAGTTFSISELSFDMHSTDASDSLGYSFPNGYNYSAAYVGLNYGADGIKGTSDDFYVDSGAADQAINELFGRGSGNAWEALSADPGATNQDKINNAAYDVWAGAGSSPFTFTGTYRISDGVNTLGSGSGTVTFAAAVAPLPNSAWAGLSLFGIVGVGALVRRKKAAGAAA